MTDWKLLIVALLITTNAAPQPSTATLWAAPSHEGVGQGDVATLRPTYGRTHDGKDFVIVYPNALVTKLTITHCADRGGCYERGDGK